MKQSRRAAQFAVIALALSMVIAILLGHGWIALALLVIVVGYYIDLRSQRDPAALQTPLTTVGQRTLALSSVFAILLIRAFW